MSLFDMIEEQGLTEEFNLMSKPTDPVWQGPCSADRNGGITFSLLNKFLICRERFRLYVVEGLREKDKFNHRLEYGNMWHLCEEYHDPSNDDWKLHLKVYTDKLLEKYRLEREEIVKWYNVCLIQFETYINYSKKNYKPSHKVVSRERVFCEPYTLPSGRIVYLRGKQDGADLLKHETKPGLHTFIQENKTKGDIDAQALRRQLKFDLQTMLYVIAFKQSDLGRNSVYPFGGVVYNVIRRPLSGGKGTIVKHKPTKKNPSGESWSEYFDRLRGIIDGTETECSPGIEHFFMRWTIEISDEDIKRFKSQCLDPLLENVCQWWEHVTDTASKGIYRSGGAYDICPHWRHPYGVYNPLNEGDGTYLEDYINSGNDAGLMRTNNLFPELQEGI